MKKSIISIIMVLISCLLGSCKKTEKIIIVKNDYSIINENLNLFLYSNIKETPYLIADNIINISLYDRNTNDLFPLEIVKITDCKNIIIKENKKFNEFEVELRLNIPNYDFINMEKAVLKIDYINGKSLKIDIGSVSILNVIENYNIKIDSLETIINDNKITKVKINLKNLTYENIKIIKINVVNAKNKAQNDNMYEIEALDEKIIEISVNGDNIINMGFVIEYLLNGEYHYQVIHNFKFIEDYNSEVNVYYV